MLLTCKFLDRAFGTTPTRVTGVKSLAAKPSIVAAPFAALFALFVLATTLRAQRAETLVRVHVTDSAGAAVSNADVVVLHGFKPVVAAGPTDAGGFRRLTVPRGDDELQVVVRQIGFLRGDRFFIANRDSVALVVRLRPTPHELSPIQITASQDLKQKRFHVNADDIAASNRLLIDGLDVVTKMRPDMMDPPGPGIFTHCGLYDIWINGKRIVFPPIDPGIAIRAGQRREVARSTANPTAGRPPRYSGIATVPVSVQSVLARIHPEHIDEMNFVDCRDSESTDMVRGQNALFVVLKPGVGYDPYRGTYALDAAVRAEAIAVSDSAVSAGAAFHHRILGVFDALTGEPIPDAQIVDVASGTFARTTQTGTVALSFLAEGASKIRIRRDGYQTLDLDVSISPRDTLPVTLTLTPKPR